MTDSKSILTLISEEKWRFIEENKRLPATIHAGGTVMRSICEEMGRFSIPIGSAIFGMTVLPCDEPGFRLE